MRKVLGLLTIVALLVIPTIAQAGYQNGSCSGGSGTFSFSNAVWIGGVGWSSGSGRTINWSGSCSNCKFVGIYGWGTNPLVEYYIGRSGGTNRGSSCGGNLYTKSCNGPNLTGNGPFTQYNASSNSRDMGCHNNGWNNLGYGTNMGGGYQVVAAENYNGGSGSATLSSGGGNWYTLWWGSGSVSFNCGGGGGSTTTTTSGGGSTTTTSGGGGGNINYRLRARSTDGQGRVNLRVDNNTIATFTLGSGMGDHSASSYNTGGINVEFFNDADNRDVQIDYLSVNGDYRQAENQSYNTAVWQNGSCGGSYSEWMHCNGVLGFGNTPGGGGGGGSSTTTTTTSGGWWWGGGGWWW
jgi:hypothetical protein